MTLKLGTNISFPNEAITETFGILAARGAGKSNTAAVMAEEMYAAGLPFVVIDPVGSWWGLRSSKTGSGPGLDIPLFGGKRGDVPLERTGGRLIADLVVDERLSCILDLTMFDSEAAKKQFLLDFAKRLYQRNEEPLHLFLEEADDYIPQRPQREEAQLLRAWENIVRRGRARGLGMTMITQRSASINKNVLTQVQTLIAMRTTGPHDRKSIEEWVKYNDESRDILKSLPSLADGEAWVWSPQFLKTTKKVKFRRRHTFDSGSTPKMAVKSKTATLADVNVDKLRERMADTIKRAEEDDPKILKRRIAELERDIKRPGAATDTVIDENRKLRADLDVANGRLQESENLRCGLDAQLDGSFELAQRLVDRLTKTDAPPERISPVATTVRTAAPSAPRPIRTPSQAAPNLGKGELRILTAIAQHTDGVSREQISVLTGYKRSSRDTYMQRLSSAGLIETGPTVTATAEGISKLGPDFELLPTGDALRSYWLDRLGGGEKALLQEVITVYPSALSRGQLSARTNYKRSSRDTYLQRLKARQLIVVSGAGVSASDKLFW